MATFSSNPKLLTMPPEIMLMIMTSADTFQSKVNLARTCSSLYDSLINDIYRQASKSKSLARAHIYEACRDGNILTLERSFQAEDRSMSHIDLRTQERFNRPLYTAIQFYQVHVVQWLLARGADPNFVGDREVSMPMLFDSPLQVAVQSVVIPGLPEWCIPERWYRLGFVMPCHYYLRWAGRVILRLLREAGAEEKSLYLRLDREHLDFIESGMECCRLHPVY
jgi:hypothetical protein